MAKAFEPEADRASRRAETTSRMSRLDEIRSQALRGLPCECEDRGCLMHPFMACRHMADVLLFRRAGGDLTGTLLCAGCAVPALESGPYSEEGTPAARVIGSKEPSGERMPKAERRS